MTSKKRLKQEAEGQELNNEQISVAEVIIELSDEKVDLVEFVRGILNFEDESK